MANKVPPSALSSPLDFVWMVLGAASSRPCIIYHCGWLMDRPYLAHYRRDYDVTTLVYCITVVNVLEQKSNNHVID